MNELGPVGIIRSSGGNLHNFSSAWRNFRRGVRKSKPVATIAGVQELLGDAWAAFADAIRSAAMANLNESVSSITAAVGGLNDALSAVFSIRPDDAELLLRGAVDSFVTAGVEGFTISMENPADEGPRFRLDAERFLETLPTDSQTITSLLHSAAAQMIGSAAPTPHIKRDSNGVTTGDKIAELGSVQISSTQLLLQSSLPAPKRPDSAVKSAADAYSGGKSTADTVSGKIPFEKTV